MLKNTILPILLIFTLAACQAQKSTEKPHPAAQKPLSESVKSIMPRTSPTAGTVRLKEGENTFLKDAQMNLTFKRTLQDSRCPMNARCIWAGNATVEIEVMTASSRPVIFKLSVGDLKNGLVNSVQFSGYEISLENLYPSNSTDHDFKDLKGRYTADLKVNRLTK